MSNHWRARDFGVGIPPYIPPPLSDDVEPCTDYAAARRYAFPDDSDPARPFRWMPVAIFAWAFLAAIWAVVWL